MIDLAILNPVITLAAFLDIVLHIKLDLQKSFQRGKSRFSEPASSVPPYAMAMVIISTLLLFLLVLFIPIAWIWLGAEWLLSAIITICNPVFLVWVFGFLFLILGMILHS